MLGRYGLNFTASCIILKPYRLIIKPEAWLSCNPGSGPAALAVRLGALYNEVEMLYLVRNLELMSYRILVTVPQILDRFFWIILIRIAFWIISALAADYLLLIRNN